MNILRDFFNMVKTKCNDDVCLMIVFIVIGFLLCYLFKDRISGFANFAPFGGENNESVEVNKSDNNKIVGIANDQAIGIELKPRKPEPSPSTKRALEVMAQKAPVSGKPINQKTGLLVQDSMMFKPFDEIWNPGFMPLDMVFKNVEKNIMGPDRPQAGPMPAQGEPQAQAQAAPQAGTKPSSASGEVNLVLLYAPWCGHSKRMLPDYERIKNEFNGQNIRGNNINVLMYDSDVDKDKIKEYGVKGFPTLYIEKNGNRELFPHRTYDKISEYLNNL